MYSPMMQCAATAWWVPCKGTHREPGPFSLALPCFPWAPSVLGPPFPRPLAPLAPLVALLPALSLVPPEPPAFFFGGPPCCAAGAPSAPSLTSLSGELLSSGGPIPAAAAVPKERHRQRQSTKGVGSGFSPEGIPLLYTYCMKELLLTKPASMPLETSTPTPRSTHTLRRTSP